MNTSYFIFPTSKMPEILDVLVQRGISLEQLMVEIIDRLEHNPDWKNVVCQNADHILDALNSGVRHDNLWPEGIYAALAVSAVLAEILETIFSEALLTLPEQDLALIDQFSRESGVGFDQLVSEALTAL